MADEQKPTSTPTPPSVGGASLRPAVSAPVRRPMPEDDFSRSLSQPLSGEDYGTDSAPENESAASVELTETPDTPATRAAKNEVDAPDGEADDASAEPETPAASTSRSSRSKKQVAADDKKAAAAKKAADAQPAADAAPAPTAPYKPEAAQMVKLADDLAEYPASAIAQAVREYPQLAESHRLLPAAQAEIQTWRSTFGDDPAKAIGEWKPFLKKIAADKEFADYLNQALTTFADYERERGTTMPAETRAVPQQPTAEQRELQRLAAWQQQQEAAQTQRYIADERARLTATDSRLEDPEVMNMVFEHAMLNKQTLTRSAQMLEARIARMAGSQRSPAAAAAGVPALVTGSGAKPRTRTNEPIDMGEQSFASLEEAKADFIKNRERYAAAGGYRIS